MVLVAIISAFFVERMVDEPAFMRHFTYWSLLAMTLFSAAWVVCIGADVRNGRAGAPVTFEAMVLLLFLFPVVALLAGVMVLIQIIPLLSPDMIPKQTQGMDLGVANLANFIIHVVPFLVYWGMVVWMRRTVRAAADAMAGPVGTVCGPYVEGSMKLAVTTTCGFVAHMGLAVLYVSFFNVNKEYTATAPLHWVYVGTALTYLVFMRVHFWYVWGN